MCSMNLKHSHFVIKHSLSIFYVFALVLVEAQTHERFLPPTEESGVTHAVSNTYIDVPDMVKPAMNLINNCSISLFELSV